MEQYEDQRQENEQLEQTIRDLKRQLDLEHRYLMDYQARGFLSFIKKQPSTPFLEKLLAEPSFTIHDRASRRTYEWLLRTKIQSTNG